MNKKAHILDWFYVVVILFAIGLSVFMGHKILNNSQLEKLWEDEGVTHVTDKSKSAILSFDNIMLFVIVGLSLFVLFSAAMVQEHPAMMFLALILLLVAVTFAGIMSNAFWDFSNTEEMADVANAFPKIVFLMNNLPIYIGFMGIAVFVVAYVSYNG